MPDVAALLEDDSATPKDVDALLASEDEPTVTREERTPTEADRAALKNYGKEGLPWYERAARGALDPIMGTAQIVQNVLPDSVLNAGRKITDPIVNFIAGGEPRDTSNTTTDQYNAAVRRDEAGYQSKRENAGQEGLDLTRIGGTLANPITWLGPVKGGPGVLAGVKAGAAAGAFQALLQPVTSSGNFFFDKAMQGALGGVLGGGLGGAFATIAPLFGKAREALGKAFGQADRNAQGAAATQVVDDALRAANAEPTRVDPVVYNAMKQEVGDALKAGVNPDPTVMTNRADAGALPVPMQYTRGQASRDNLLYSWEINNSKRAGYEELNNTLTTQNRQLVENLDELGARNALSPFEASQQAIAKIQEVDGALTQQIDAAYANVRNSAGRPALMNHQAFLNNAREGLKQQQVSEFLPKEIRDTMNALELGNAPLTVDVAQQLDKVWSRAQRSTQDGNAKVAIGELRKALNSAPVADDLGQEAMQAYQAARGLAKQRYDLIEANPAFKAISEGSSKAEPEKFFQNFVAGANTSEIPGLKQLVGPELTKTLQNTAVRGLKKAAVGSASDGNAVFSQAGYNNVIHSEVAGPRLRELFSDDPVRLGHLYRLGRVAENIGKYPANHSVNTSNTAPVAAEMVREAAESVAGRTVVGGLINTAREANARAAARQAVRDSVSTGVTKAPIVPKTSAAQARLSDLIARGAGAAAPQDKD